MKKILPRFPNWKVFSNPRNNNHVRWHRTAAIALNVSVCFQATERAEETDMESIDKNGLNDYRLKPVGWVATESRLKCVAHALLVQRRHSCRRLAHSEKKPVSRKSRHGTLRAYATSVKVKEPPAKADRLKGGGFGPGDGISRWAIAGRTIEPPELTPEQPGAVAARRKDGRRVAIGPPSRRDSRIRNI